jgi:hypothetical protein
LLIFLVLAVFTGTCAWIVKVRVVDRALWLGFWWVKYLRFPASGWNAEVEVLEGMEEGSASVIGALVTTGLVFVVAEATKAALSEAVEGSMREFAKTTVGNVMDELVENATDMTTIVYVQLDTIPESATATHHVEL